MTKKLKAKHEMFCREFLVDLNATQAAIRSGYAAQRAHITGPVLANKPEVKARINELKAERIDQLGIDANYVLKRLVEIDQMDVIDILNDDMTIKPINEWPETWRRTIQGVDLVNLASKDDLDVILKKIKWPDKVKNLELLGRHITVNAFKDVQEVNINVALADKIAKARKRVGGCDD